MDCSSKGIYHALERQGSDNHPGQNRVIVTAAMNTTLKQLTLVGILAKSAPFSSESVKYKLLVNATADFICQGLQPLSVVDGPEFRHVLEIAELRFKLPHHMYSTDTVIHTSKNHSTRAAIEKQLAEVHNCVAQYLISVPF